MSKTPRRTPFRRFHHVEGVKKNAEHRGHSYNALFVFATTELTQMGEEEY
jgi:hypothetical protein